jgi:hypothetical protein
MATVNVRELRQFIAGIPDEMVYVNDPVHSTTASIIGLGLVSGMEPNSTAMYLDIDAKLMER